MFRKATSPIIPKIPRTLIFIPVYTACYTNQMHILNYNKVKYLSETCFGTSVPKPGRTQNGTS